MVKNASIEKTYDVSTHWKSNGYQQNNYVTENMENIDHISMLYLQIQFHELPLCYVEPQRGTCVKRLF